MGWIHALRDIIGTKATAAATGAVTETDQMMAYVKQLVTQQNAQDNVIGTVATAAATGAVTATDLLMAYVKQLVTEGIARDAVIGAVDTAAATGAVTATDMLMAYVKQLVTELQVVDEYHDVPAANNTLNAQINEVIGNKSDTAAAGAVTTTDTLAAYIKQLVGEGIARDAVLTVLGAINTAAATGAVTDTDLLMAYIKQLVTELQVVDEYHDVPAANNTLNAQINEVVGNKTDAAAAGAVTETDTLVGYVKQLVTEGIARDAVLTTIDDFLDTEVAAILAAVDTEIGAMTATAVYSPTTDKDLMAYLKGVADLQEKVAFSAAAAALTDAATIFTITGGPIVIRALVSICIATGDAGAATLQWTATPTVGTATTFSGSSGSLATAVLGSTVTLIGTALATAPLLSTVGPSIIQTGPSSILIPAGVIKTTVGGAASTATWKHYLRYTPLATGVTVTA